MSVEISGPYHEAVFWRSRVRFEVARTKQSFAHFTPTLGHCYHTRANKRKQLTESSGDTSEGNELRETRSQQQKKLLLTSEVFDSYEPVQVCTGCALLGGCVECAVFNTSAFEEINFFSF